jgi:hypothetical protein
MSSYVQHTDMGALFFSNVLCLKLILVNVSSVEKRGVIRNER